MNNRFDVFPNHDYSFKIHSPQKFVPDLSMLDSLLGGLQKEYDTGSSTLARIMPNYLRNSPTDVAAAKAFRTKYDKLIKESTDAFSAGNINEGRRIMSNALREVEKDQLPGGDYYELGNRVDQFKAITDNYKTKFKDAPGEYLNEVLSRINLTPFRDASTGEVNAIGDPNIGAYINIGEELDKRLNGFKADKGTIVRIGDKWVYKESKEEVRPEDVQRAANTILGERRFQQQLGIEADISARSIDKAGLDEANKKYAASLLSGLSPRQLQQKLKKEGYYKGAIDGKIGPDTKAAIADFTKDNSSYYKDERSLAGNRVIETYVNPLVDKYAYTSIDKDTKVNSYALEKEKIDYMNYNPFAGISIPGRDQEVKNHSFNNLEDITSKNKTLQAALTEKLNRLAEEAGVSNAENLFKLSDEALMARGISPEKVRMVEYQKKQGEKQIKINKQIKQDALDAAAKRFGKDKEKLYQQGMAKIDSILPDTFKVIKGWEKGGAGIPSKEEVVSAVKSGYWKNDATGSDVLILDGPAGSIKFRLGRAESKAFKEATKAYKSLSSQVREFDSSVDTYVKNTQQGKLYQPELFTNVVIRDEEGNVNPTATKNATEYMQEFVSNPTNLGRYKYIDKNGDEMYYQMEAFMDDLPLDKDGNPDFKQMNLSFSGITKDANPAFGTPTFELSYINDDAELKTLHAPVPVELTERIIYPGGKKPDDGLLSGNSGWNIKQEGIWKANSNIQEAIYQAGSKYETEEGTFYLNKHPKSDKPISSDQQFVFLTNDGEELSPTEYRQYMVGLKILNSNLKNE